MNETDFYAREILIRLRDDLAWWALLSDRAGVLGAKVAAEVVCAHVQQLLGSGYLDERADDESG